ncbi:MAG: sigma-70 family RNA polymerase sigma factor, partial [Nanoarchaeota archaeon]
NFVLAVREVQVPVKVKDGSLIVKEIDKKTYEVIEEASVNYEKELVKKVKESKDREAFFKLVKMHDARIYSLVIRYLGNKEDATEITQDVFIQAYRKIHQFRGESVFYYWLQRIAVNFCLNKIRNYKKDPLKRAESLDESDSFWYERHLKKDPTDIMEEKEKNVFVRQCLMKVAPDYRMVLMLRDIEGLAYEEIASLLKCSMGTVKSRIARGREELKRISKNESAVVLFG